MKINWKIRLKQKTFLVAMASSLFVAAQAVGSLFGYSISDTVGEDLMYTFNTILGVLIIGGVVSDGTTEGFSDSKRALKYNEPN